MAKRRKPKPSQSPAGDLPLFDAGRVPAPQPEPAAPRRRRAANAAGPAAADEPSPAPEQPTPETANGSAEHPLTVSQLARGIGDVLDTCFPNVWVVGQVSGLKRAASGHMYFDLKDDDACVQCVMWRSAVARMRSQVTDGMEAIARGHVGFYKTGRCQLYVEQLEPRGLGALEIRFRELKERLQKEGLFDTERKRPLPRLPRTVGVVTSPRGAAIRDIVHVLTRRWPGLRILLYGVRVQGDGAAEEIARAVRDVDRHLSGTVDVLIIGRGGGSAEDLWAFNEEVVARAVAECRIPVISAVGHETDFSISDFVADVRAPTPSAAAEIAVPDRRDLARHVGTTAARLRRAAEHLVRDVRSRLLLAAGHRFFRYPAEITGLRATRVDELAGRAASALGAAVERRRRGLHDLERRLLALRPAARLARQRGRLEGLVARHGAIGPRLTERQRGRLDRAVRGLEALSPLAVLGRGYSITLDAETRRAIRAADQVRPGDLLETILADRQKVRSRAVDQMKDKEES